MTEKEPDSVNIKELTEEEIVIAYEREKSYRSLYYFFRLCMDKIYTHIGFVNNWHYKAICDILQQEVERMERKEKTEKHLLINLPIRALKTILISEIFPCWLWIRNSQYMIQNICATQDLATQSSRMSKIIITSLFFQERFPEVILAKDSKAKSDYSTTNHGHRVSFGVGSSIIGSSFDVCIIDDPNDPNEALSDTSIKNVISTYKDVISGRANNNWALKIILQQRTSSRDLCGYLLKHNSQDYRHICIPAELTKDTSPEFIKYYIDGLFFPERYGHEELAVRARTMSATAYASQLLQSPSSVQGTIYLREFLSPIMKASDFQKLKKEKICLFIDTNMGGENKNNDPTGMLVCCSMQGKVYVMDFIESHKQLFELCQDIIELTKKYNINRCYIENKAMGTALISELRRQLRQAIAISDINPGAKSKVERLNAVQPYLANKRFILVEDEWNEKFTNNCVNFPQKGVPDESVDLTVYAILTLIAGKSYGAAEQPTEDRRGMTDDDDYLDDIYK